MRTGNVVLDMMIAMSIPLALQGAFKFWEWLRPRIEDFLYSLRQKEEHFIRSIEYEKVRSGVHHSRSILQMQSTKALRCFRFISLQHTPSYSIIRAASPDVVYGKLADMFFASTNRVLYS